MSRVLFFDLEINKKSRKIEKIGAILDGVVFGNSSIEKFYDFGKEADFVCGHNIIDFDLPALKNSEINRDFFKISTIDTLYLSALLFSEKPYHRLVKNYKLVDESDEINNPVSDAKLTRQLLIDEYNVFSKSDTTLKSIYYFLLKNVPGFEGFFKVAGFSTTVSSLKDIIIGFFKGKLCKNSDLTNIIDNAPVTLAYSLSLILTGRVDSISPPWLLQKHPDINEVMYVLRQQRCDDPACEYCRSHLDPKKSLLRFFGYDNFRKFSEDEKIPLQEQVVEAALQRKSLLAIFPTGGGKSLSFQLPALMAGEAGRELTVIISPLQSLMKDQVDNLENRFGITAAVTINGLLSPVERKEAFERIETGVAHILYISPESLRSPSLINLLNKRAIARFVIDEAHCFSSWGHDFRVDYLYIGDFISELVNKKGLKKNIQVSCFTATAKPQVINDIKNYFKSKLQLELIDFLSDSKRTNLRYGIFSSKGNEEKFNNLKKVLSQSGGPAIVYVARTKIAENLALSLQREGFDALPYHGQMETKQKIANQNEFMSGEADIIVATSAFGMGVDKDDIKLIVHYDIPDSLENYIQETGRAGRNASLQADCFVLFDENDLSKHFTLFYNTRLNLKEIAQVWRGIKALGRYRSGKITKSALEIAKSAGWDTEMRDLETRITTAVAVLEDAGFIKRTQNSPRVFADSFLVKNVEKAGEIIRNSEDLHKNQKTQAQRIIQRIIKDDETQVDYLADTLGISKDIIVHIINVLRNKKIIGDAKDLTAYVDTSKSKNGALIIFKNFIKIEKELLQIINNEPKQLFLKEINTGFINKGLEFSTVDMLKEILRFWQINNFISRERINSNNLVYKVKYKFKSDIIAHAVISIEQLSASIIEYLTNKKELLMESEPEFKEHHLLKFSLLELKENIEVPGKLFGTTYKVTVYERALLYLNSIGALKLEGGFLIFYKPMNISRIIMNNRKQFTKDDYKKLKIFYEGKIEQIHIMGEYAKKLLLNYSMSIRFVDDYFKLPYDKFVSKYFPKRRKEIKRPITPQKFRQIFGTLSPAQLQIINDDINNKILVAAGPGSGKTKVLVHKIAAMLMLEDIKPEQFLMLTFSRAAAMEFKKRLHDLMGNVAWFIDIYTYHSYCFNLLGRLGNLEKSESIIGETLEKIKNGDVPFEKISGKSVLVIDEFQDVNEEEFGLITEIARLSQQIRILAVGDDDQNIYGFRGSSVKYMTEFKEKQNAKSYELLTNFRSKNNLVDFANLFAQTIQNRLKKNPVKTYTIENGIIEINKFTGQNLIIPLTLDLINKNCSDTTAILTATNEEAALVDSVLKSKNISSKLLLSNDTFKIGDLDEIKTFSNLILSDIDNSLGVISDVRWKNAKGDLQSNYRKSENLSLSLKIIETFEKNYKQKFRNDWLSFISEVNTDDFIYNKADDILVSTMHKAKGREFDNVFLLLKDYYLINDEKKRAVYVAITRAKTNLFIYTNQNYFDGYDVINLDSKTDSSEYVNPEKIFLYLTHKDIDLGFFKLSGIKNAVSNIYAGDNLLLSEKKEGLKNLNNKYVLKFSKKFRQTYNKWTDAGYGFEKAKVNFVAWWYDRDEEKEFKVILPEIELAAQMWEDKKSVMD